MPLHPSVRWCSFRAIARDDRRAIPAIAAACLAVFWVALAPAQAQDPEELVRRGRALFSQGKFDEAERLYRQAIAINPASFEGGRALGVLLTLKGQYPEARMHFQKAMSAGPTPTVRHQTRAQLALSYAFEGKLEDVQREYEQLRKLQQMDGDLAGAAAAARSLGRILLEGGDVANGRKWYEIGYEEWKPGSSQPETERLLWELRLRHMHARVAAREGRLDEARRLLGEFEALMQKRGRQAEDNDFYRWVAGYVAYYAKEYDQAITHLTNGDLQDPFILNLIGKSYEGKGQMDIARDYYRRVVESNAYNLQSAIARPHAKAKLAAAGGQ